MGFLQNGPIYLYSGRFLQKAMDSRIFSGSSERDFGSYGRQKFAYVKLNLDSIFVYLSRLKFDGGGGASTVLNISLLKALKTLLPGRSSV